MKLFGERFFSGENIIYVFTIVIAVSIALSLLVAYLSPSQRQKDALNKERWEDVGQILNAIDNCASDNNGVIKNCGFQTPTKLSQIGNCRSGGEVLCPGAATECLNLEMETSLDSYIKKFPTDPSLYDESRVTAYAARFGNDGVLTIKACLTDEDETISVSRRI